MTYEEAMTQWARQWRRPADVVMERFRPIFGKWPAYKLQKLFEKADLEFNRFPSPNQLRNFALEAGIWEASSAPSMPQGCPLCNWTGFVSVETPKGHVVAATCQCELGRYRQRLSEERPYEDGNIYPRTSVLELKDREGYRVHWAHTCYGCKHWRNGKCDLTDEEKKPGEPACMKFEEV